MASLDWAKTTARQDVNQFNLGIWCAYIRDFMVFNPVLIQSPPRHFPPKISGATWPLVQISKKESIMVIHYVPIVKRIAEYIYSNMIKIFLTHLGWVTHICVGNLIITGSDNGLLLGRRQAIISTSAGILLIGPLGTNINEIVIEIHTF